MELGNFYRLTFDSKEILIETKVESTERLFNLLTKKDSIIIQKSKESEPIFLNKDKLFSVEKVKETGLSKTNNKIWRLL